MPWHPKRNDNSKPKKWISWNTWAENVSCCRDCDCPVDLSSSRVTPSATQAVHRSHWSEPHSMPLTLYPVIPWSCSALYHQHCSRLSTALSKAAAHRPLLQKPLCWFAQLGGRGPWGLQGQLSVWCPCEGQTILTLEMLSQMPPLALEDHVKSF